MYIQRIYEYILNNKMKVNVIENNINSNCEENTTRGLIRFFTLYYNNMIVLQKTGKKNQWIQIKSYIMQTQQIIIKLNLSFPYIT